MSTPFACRIPTAASAPTGSEHASVPTIPERVLETTGHMVEWLVFSLPREELVAGPIVKSVDFLNRMLLDNRDRDWAVGPKGHALHALAIYDERVFGSTPGKRPFLVSRPY